MMDLAAPADRSTVSPIRPCSSMAAMTTTAPTDASATHRPIDALYRTQILWRPFNERWSALPCCPAGSEGGSVGDDVNSGAERLETAAHILVVDDDQEICSLLERYLRLQGFRVSVANHGSQMEACLATANIGLVVLDVVLPDVSGLDLCRSLRSRSSIPIILLTALKEDVDRIIGLELGADDYLCKPFNPRELVARIRAILRRVEERGNHHDKAPGHVFRFEGFVAEPETRRVVAADGTEIVLTAAEFSLLMAFLERPGKLLSRNQLLDITQGRDAEPLDRSIDVLVSRLRRKLNGTGRQLLKTQRNGGYQFAARVEFAEPLK
jgi:two-component system, OmpR family, response regulator